MEQLGRRPLLGAFDNNTSQMLENIRQSLSNVRTNENDVVTSSSIERTNSLRGQKSVGYNEKALREIRQSLKECQVRKFFV